MNKLWLSLISIVLCIGCIASVTVVAQLLVGVKEGDWIEYNITYTGTPPEYYPERARIEVNAVEGTQITAEITTRRLNGTSDTQSGTFDLITGTPELLLIPANLDLDDNFYSDAIDNNITITGIDDSLYAYARRTVVSATVSQIEFSWDQATGILLKADQTTDVFTQKWLIAATNIWQAQMFGLDPTMFYALLLVGIAVIVSIAIILLRRFS
jgi:hypothetical protein